MELHLGCNSRLWSITQNRDLCYPCYDLQLGSLIDVKHKHLSRLFTDCFHVTTATISIVNIISSKDFAALWKNIYTKQFWNYFLLWKRRKRSFWWAALNLHTVCQWSFVNIFWEDGEGVTPNFAKKMYFIIQNHHFYFGPCFYPSPFCPFLTLHNAKTPFSALVEEICRGQKGKLSANFFRSKILIEGEATPLAEKSA